MSSTKKDLTRELSEQIIHPASPIDELRQECLARLYKNCNLDQLLDIEKAVKETFAETGYGTYLDY